jgi:hypothetical protein
MNKPAPSKPLSQKSKEWSQLILQIQMEVHIKRQEKQAEKS